MLQKLSIRNYALIDRLDLEFDDGLTIITGETGAGKSIILGALSLLLGGRAETKAIADGSSKSVVEAVFARVDESLRAYFEINDLDWNREEVIIRREISATGRSRAFVNDRPVTLALLSDITSSLIDIHSQHANARINDAALQLDIIDSVSGTSQLLEAYSADFHRFVRLHQQIRKRREEIDRVRATRDVIALQLEQLDQLNPKPGELAEIERRFEMLSDADEIRERLMTLRRLLGNPESGVADVLRDAKGEAEKIDFSLFERPEDEREENEPQDTESIPSRLQKMIIEAVDLAETVGDMVSDVEADPAALSKLSDRMNAYYGAIRHFRVKDGDELAQLREELRRKLDAIDGNDSRLPELEREAKTLAHSLKEQAGHITEMRIAGAGRFSRELSDAARPLGLQNIRFVADVTVGKLSATGQNKVEFLCAFNKNQQPAPVSKFASGGEISRLMLAMKCILAGRMNLPTIIFDEVDTGVSGEVADMMGEMMLAMSRRMQVITITHLPQVAAKGRSHFKVFKHDDDSRTLTNVIKLSRDQRIREIAAMMSGREVTDAALRNAEMLIDKSRE